MRRVLLAVLAAAGLSGCGLGSWFYGGDSNVEPPTPLAEFTPGFAVQEAWNAEFGAAGGKQFLKLGPLLRNGAVYVGSQEGVLRAYSAPDGKLLWELQLGLPFSSAVGFGDGLLFVGTHKGQVVAVSPDSGKLLWTATVSSEILAPPAAHAGTVVVQVADGRIFGLGTDNGETRWSLERGEPALSLRGTSAPLIVAGVALTGFANGKIAAIDLRAGRLLWETAVAEPRGRSEIERLIDVDSPPLVVGTVLYAAAFQGKIVAVSLEDGRVRWSREVSTYAELDSDGTNLYVADERGHVHALNLQTGATAWKQDKLQARGLNAPTVVGRQVAVGDYQGFVHWLSAEDGHFVARHQVRGGAVRSKPVTDQKTLYVAAQGGTLSALLLRPN